MASDKPRLLLFITELLMGGAARVVRDHADAFSGHYDVYEAVFDQSLGMDFGGAHMPVSLDRGEISSGPLRPLANLWRRVRRLRRVKRELGIDVSISHLEGAHYVDLLSRGREKIILCVHGSLLGNRLVGGLGWAIRKRLLIPLFYNRADAVVTVSRDIAPELVSLGVRPGKIRTINNFFDVAGIAAAARESLTAAEAAIFEGAPVLATAGRIHVQKNPAPLLDMMAQLKPRRRVKLLFVGDGDMRDELIARSQSLGLRTFDAWSGVEPEAGHDVYFVGKQDNVFKFLGRSSLFVLPSSWEGFPLALCEAMACGTAVVSADCPTGPREILAPETAVRSRPLRQRENGAYGVLMPMLNAPETYAADLSVWVETLVELLDDDDRRRRMGEAGQARMQDFTREKIVPQWLDLVGELVGQRR